MTNKRDYAVVIGRFQPLHNGHLSLIRQALSIAKNVLVVFGSARGPRTVKNPWTFADRVKMLELALAPEEWDRVFVISVGDYLYNDPLWVAELQEKVELLTATDNIVLVGHNKDRSTYYLSLFPHWSYFETYNPAIPEELNATEIREQYFTLGPPCTVNFAMSQYLRKVTDEKIAEFLIEFTRTEEYSQLRDEYDCYEDSRERYGTGPFLTADAVVISRGHVLLVQRKNAPGKGLYALPGGFVDSTEFIERAALRELHEETGIRLSPDSIKEAKVFDHPDRSLRGRVVTVAHLIQISDTKKFKPRAGDDAAKAFWLPINEALSREHLFFEDHHSILRYFLLRY